MFHPLQMHLFGVFFPTHFEYLSVEFKQENSHSCFSYSALYDFEEDSQRRLQRSVREIRRYVCLRPNVSVSVSRCGSSRSFARSRCNCNRISLESNCNGPRSGRRNGRLPETASPRLRQPPSTHSRHREPARRDCTSETFLRINRLQGEEGAEGNGRREEKGKRRHPPGHAFNASSPTRGTKKN